MKYTCTVHLFSIVKSVPRTACFVYGLLHATRPKNLRTFEDGKETLLGGRKETKTNQKEYNGTHNP